MSLVRKYVSFDFIFLFFVSAVVFLPYSIQLTYYLDDWYYVYDGVVAGPNIFHSMFSVDRPARGYFFDIFFSLFGPNPFPYHVGAYFWRLLAGVGTLFLLGIIWPENKRINLLISMLFTLYPGYSWWVSAIEYQPMAASLTLQIFSVVFSLLAVRTEKIIEKLLWALGAVFSGWAYIALVDYAIGAEVFRFLCFYLMIPYDQHKGFFNRLYAVLKEWLPYFTIVLGFVFWRVFIFQSQRRATDVNFHLGRLKANPLDYVLEVGADFLYSITNAGFSAWYRQLYLKLAEFNFKVPVMGIILVTMVFVLLLLVWYKWGLQKLIQKPGQVWRTPIEAVWLGGVSLVLGVVPVVAFGRFINLNIYSHYSLPVSLPSALLVAGLVCWIFPSERVRIFLLSALVVSASLTNVLIAERTLKLEDSFEKFWWQAAWRIPGIRPDTTLVTLYPYEKVVDNVLGLPEAPNFIYFSSPRNEIPVRYFVSTMMPTPEHIESILLEKHRKRVGYRTHEMIIQYNNVVVLTQPNEFSCVRVIDGRDYIVSENDSEDMKKIFSSSRIENIRMTGGQVDPPAYAFGDEPEHGWCYYFQKADLAVQERDWVKAASLGDTALSLKLEPVDQVEWFPFIQAYAMTANEEKLNALSIQMASDKFLGDQVCEWSRGQNTYLSPEAEKLLEKFFCD